MTYPCNGLLLGKELKVKVIMWLNFEDTVVSERRQSRKSYILCDLHEMSQNRQIHRHKK